MGEGISFLVDPVFLFLSGKSFSKIVGSSLQILVIPLCVMNEVIQYGNLYYFPCGTECPCYIRSSFRWFRIAARVIVCEDYGNGLVP